MKRTIFGVLGLLTSASLAVAQPAALPQPGASATAPAAGGAAPAMPMGPGAPMAAMPGGMPVAGIAPFVAPPPPCDAPACPPMMESVEGIPVEKQCKPCKEAVFWGEIDYILWQVSRPEINVPLVTTGSRAVGQQGLIGASSTSTVFGNDALTLEDFSGMRARVGWCVGCVGVPAVEVSGFYLSRRAVSASVSSTGDPGSPVLSRPYFDTTGGGEAVQVFALPGQFAGGFSAVDKFGLWSLEVNNVIPVCDVQKFSSTFSADILLGYRRMNIDERFRTRTDTVVLPGGRINFAGVTGLGAGTVITSQDQVDATNELHAGQLGVRLVWEPCRFSVAVTGKVALGEMFETRNAFGQTTLLTGAGRTVPGTILVPLSAAGSQHHGEFTVMPEGEVTIRYQLTDHVTLNVGYHYLHIDNILRPGNTLSRNINPAQLPTSANFNPTAGAVSRPATNVNQSELEAYGVSFGIGFSF